MPKKQFNDYTNKLETTQTLQIASTPYIWGIPNLFVHLVVISTAW